MTSHRFQKHCLPNSAVFTALSFQVGPTTAGAGIDGAACGSSGQAQGAVTIPGANIFCKSKLAPTTSQVYNAPVTVAKGPPGTPLFLHNYSRLSYRFCY